MKRDPLSQLPVINGAQMRGARTADVVVLASAIGVFIEVSSLTAGAGPVAPGQKFGKQIHSYQMETTLFLNDLIAKTGDEFDLTMQEMGAGMIDNLFRSLVRDGYFPAKEFERYAKNKAERRAAKLQDRVEGDAADGERPE